MCNIWWYEPQRLLEPYKSSYANPPHPSVHKNPSHQEEEQRLKLSIYKEPESLLIMIQVLGGRKMSLYFLFKKKKRKKKGLKHILSGL